MWDEVVGQERAVDLLARAVTRPVHSYLLVGPPGSGVEELARCFGAALVCAEGGCGTCSACQRALRGRHPDVVEFEPDGSVIRVEQVAEMVDAAYLAPFEAPRKVLVVHEVERLHEAAANKLLKTLEEPPPRTHFVLITGAAEELLETVVSRCQMVECKPLSSADVSAALLASGVPSEQVDGVVRLAGGRLDRARRLAGDWAPLRAAVVDAVRRLDGTGAAAAVASGEVAAAIDAALAALEAEHGRELAALEEEIAAATYSDRAAGALRRRLRERHGRIVRRAKTGVIMEVITAIESVFRDALVAPAAALDPDHPPLRLSVDACLRGIDACRHAMKPLSDRNLTVNDGLLLDRLLLNLPATSLTGLPV
jgi:DNA polymerase-3 subunit delta'